MKTLKRYLIFVALLNSMGCAHFNFVSRSAYLNDNSLYFNDSLKLSIQLPGDFILYSPKNKNGIRLKHLCKADKNILKLLDLNKTNTKILFDGTPVVPPFYNLIGVLQDDVGNDISPSVSKQKIDGYDIGVGTILYKGKLIKLIYYNKPDKECPYCDIDSITMTNNKRLNAQMINNGYYNDLNNCAAAGRAYTYTIPLTYRGKKRLIFEAYVIDQSDSSKKLYSFRLLSNRANGGVKLKLCPGNYMFKLRNFRNKTLTDTSVVIKTN